MNIEVFQKYRVLLSQIKKTIDNPGKSRDEKLQKICQMLADEVEVFDWVGFYIVDPDAERELVLGPFVGEPTEHTRIPFGTGICGQAAETNETFVVQDVSKEDNYLACSIDVKSEIVVPIRKNGNFVAELDIDSHTKGAITEDHRKFLEEVCDITASLF
jgi:GAF domain-containing protein